MRKVVIHTQPGFDEWREHARGFLKSRIAPDQIIWTIPEQTQTNLFTDDIVETSPLPDEHGLVEIRVSKAFMEMAETVLCHNDPERFGLMYKILWRLNFENRSLMSLKTDDDI